MRDGQGKRVLYTKNEEGGLRIVLSVNNVQSLMESLNFSTVNKVSVTVGL